MSDSYRKLKTQTELLLLELTKTKDEIAYLSDKLRSAYYSIKLMSVIICIMAAFSLASKYYNW